MATLAAAMLALTAATLTLPPNAVDCKVPSGNCIFTPDSSFNTPAAVTCTRIVFAVNICTAAVVELRYKFPPTA